ncbi:MFS transporter [Neisseriaceae bacterium JH1-16]|nr:MFS transporter [Neisseriaceae bacterium JH1-16]
MPFAILLLAAAGFTVLTTEFLIIGLLPALARDLGVGVAQAGLLVSLFALVVALTGPLLTARVSRIERRRLFVALLVLFGAANLLAALAPDFATMAVARLLPALGVAVFWSMACETAVDMLGSAQAGRALAMMAYGMVAATVFGIPLGTLLGEAFGWRCWPSPMPRC